MSKGAGEAPVVWAGEYDPTLTYLPRQLVSVSGTPYMSLAKQTGVDPPGASWLAFGGGGGADGFRAGAGVSSVIGGDLFPADSGLSTATDRYALVVGGGATAGYHATAVGTFSWAPNDYCTAYGYGSYAADGPSNTAVGMFSTANPPGGQGTAVGRGSSATKDHATSVGASAIARSLNGIAIGYAAQGGSPSFEDYAIAIGAFSGAFGNRSIALGTSAGVTDDDLGVVRVDNWEVWPSGPGSVETGLIVHDSAGVRWRWAPDTSGALVVTAA